ncbi:MAG: DUF2520 domain-containing protein [Acidobacteriota bacterium]
MGQVPCAKPWLLLGDGRLATHLATYLRHLGIPCRQWSRRHGWHSPAPDGNPPLADAIAHHDRVLVALADDALADCIQQYRQSDGPIWVHFSGSRCIDGAWSAHPLCTFGPEPYAAEIYSTIPFVLEREGPGLAQLLPGLKNPQVRIPGADKALYHAFCVLAGNSTTLLWQWLFAELEERWGIDPAVAIPYLRRTATNLESAEPQTVLTGPLARGDAATIQRNLAALEAAQRPELAELYRAFTRAASPQAKEVAA